jgi:hypothetical protein
MRVYLHCTLGNAPPPKRGKTLNVRIGSASTRFRSSGLFPRPCAPSTHRADIRRRLGDTGTLHTNLRRP